MLCDTKSVHASTPILHDLLSIMLQGMPGRDGYDGINGRDGLIGDPGKRVMYSSYSAVHLMYVCITGAVVAVNDVNACIIQSLGR